MHNDYCAIDFGTSNSAIAIPVAAAMANAGNHALRPLSSVPLQNGSGELVHQMRLVKLEGKAHTMPTAIFYSSEDPSILFGRAAIAAYVDGADGRLLRSIKSILGTDLMTQTTDVGHGIAVSYIDVVVAYLKQLKNLAETAHGGTLNRVVIGRPARFIDDDDKRDQQAEDALKAAAIAAGFIEVRFQFEPIAAALDYESRITATETVLVADIGGGTSDFSVVRVGGESNKQNREADILANVGVHIAGTDFDQAISIAAIMPSLGLGSIGPASQYHRRVPSKIYFDLATWHLINTVYSHNRAIELREMRVMYADKVCYARLEAVVKKRLGHRLAAKAEAAKIDVAQHGSAIIALDEIEENLNATFDAARQAEALSLRVNNIVEVAVAAARNAKLQPDEINTLYFTGGSTGLIFLTEQIAAKFPSAKIAAGDRFASVVAGLGIEAARQYGTAYKETSKTTVRAQL